MKVASYAYFLLLWLLMSYISTAEDTINATQSLHVNQNLISGGGSFKLGFFSPANSSRIYVGIWYTENPNPVWVANRDSPLLDSSGFLQVTNKSVLRLVNSTGGVIWSTNSSRSNSTPVAQLLDNGNLVVRDQEDNKLLWQSFDYPSDCQLSGMKLGKNLVTGFDWLLTSWKSNDDPSPGSYRYRIDPQGYPQLLLFKGSDLVFRNGPWTGVGFSGDALPNTTMISQAQKFVVNNKEIYYIFELLDVALIILNHYGAIQRQIWDEHTQNWYKLFSMIKDECDNYGICGEFSSCNIEYSPLCQCMKGYVPKSPEDWNARNWTGGCVRGTALNCSIISDGFIKYSNVQLPDTRFSWYSKTLTLEDCRSKCLKNCTCVAYANLDVTYGGSGCLLWFKTIIDLKVTGFGQNLYVRVPSSELGIGNQRKRVWIAVSSSLSAFMLLCGIAFLIIKRRRQKKEEKRRASIENNINENSDVEFELPVYAFDVISKATNSFSVSCKLGVGGFGPVYKGVLSNGQEIAVKRLSKYSRQGPKEFKNEVTFIAKLQHRNLVKLIGCCAEAEERLLIYEYMPKQSLDRYIFDTRSNHILDWPKRLEIIKGIARGLLYLHEDSRLRIVHRDLKASNILLDSEMNPKISDFGLARAFDGNEEEAKTKRVVGTYGYMPPEYTIDGRFSVKSDVFSYGVLVLEIVSGKRNRGFDHPAHHHNLLGHAWMLFREEVALDVVDPLLQNTSYEPQMKRLIHIGLLCVQQHPRDRPSMSLVTVMLSSDCELPDPKQPGFYVGRNLALETISGISELCSDDLTVLFVGR